MQRWHLDFADGVGDGSKEASFVQPIEPTRTFRSLRHISLVKRHNFLFQGSIGNQGMALGDVDQDGDVELCVGGVNGTLAVFRHSSPRPWLTASGMGSILCVQVITMVVQVASVDPSESVNGSGLNSTTISWSQPFIITFSAEGQCSALTVRKSGPHRELVSHTVSQRLPRNIEAVTSTTLAKKGEEGTNYIILGGIDRTVHVYRLSASRQRNTLFSVQFDHVALYRVEYAVTSLALQQQLDSTVVFIGLANSTFAVINIWLDQEGHPLAPNRDSKASEHHVLNTCTMKPVPGPSMEKCYVATGKTKAARSIVIGVTQDGVVNWMEVSREPRWVLSPPLSHNEAPSTPSTASIGSQNRPPMGAKELDDRPWTSPAPCSLLWSCHLSHGDMVLHGPHLMDISGKTEVCICTWSGNVYLIDRSRNAIRFSLQEPIMAFTQGVYSINPRQSRLSLIFATFDGRICIYTDITDELRTVKAHHMMDSILEVCEPYFRRDDEETASAREVSKDGDHEVVSSHTERYFGAKRHDLRRNVVKKVRAVLYNITPDEMKRLKAYRKELEGRVAAMQLRQKGSGRGASCSVEKPEAQGVATDRPAS